MKLIWLALLVGTVCVGQSAGVIEQYRRMEEPRTQPAQKQRAPENPSFPRLQPCKSLPGFMCPVTPKPTKHIRRAPPIKIDGKDGEVGQCLVAVGPKKTPKWVWNKDCPKPKAKQ